MRLISRDTGNVLVLNKVSMVELHYKWLFTKYDANYIFTSVYSVNELGCEGKIGT